MNIGLNIRNARKQCRMTQEQLAHRLGYKSKSSIAKIELGENGVPPSKLQEFANALNVNINCIIGIEEYTPPINNTVRFICKNGKCDEYALTDEQFTLLKAVADQFPDSDNDQL